TAGDYQVNANIGFWGTYPVVAWEDKRFSGYPTYVPRRIFVNFLNRDGTQRITNGEDLTTLSYQDGNDQAYPLVLPTASPDTAAIVFNSDGSGNYGWGIYAQRVASSGARGWGSGNGVTVCDPLYDQSNNWEQGPYAVADVASRSFTVTWQDNRGNDGHWRVY